MPPVSTHLSPKLDNPSSGAPDDQSNRITTTHSDKILMKEAPIYIPNHFLSHKKEIIAHIKEVAELCDAQVCHIEVRELIRSQVAKIAYIVYSGDPKLF